MQVTGQPRVDAALERLEQLADEPLAHHVAIYEQVHELLQDALADLDGDGA